jgi:preprotein translocase subunit SecD
VLYQLGPAFALGELAIDSAEPTLDGSNWAVSLTLKSGADGLDAWNKMSQICYAAAFSSGPADQCSGGMAFVLDHRVVSAPTPSQESGGFFTSPTIQITGGAGGFDEPEAKQIAQILNYGATPVEMKAESAQTVSATLGKDSLHAGIVSGLIGIALVVLFMLLYYRSLAAVLLVGLTVSGALLWSVISLLSTTNGLALTLAGVTGIIVSVGVTIDSYVVFFERLKDEVRSGKTFRASAARGFTGAWRTILAADTVSLIGAIVLFYLSVGSVRGFAFFLGLSTACDLVVAWFFTRPAVLLLSRSKLFQGGRLLGVDAVANTTVGVAS